MLNIILKTSIKQIYVRNFVNSFCAMAEAGPKYNGMVKKRKWEERISEGGSDEKKQCTPFERVKKRKFAVLLGYSGVDYYGMQR